MESNPDESKAAPTSINQVRRALAMVDQTFHGLPEKHRRQAWAALLIASIPHWLGPDLLAHLCETTTPEADRLFSNLQKLPCALPFHEQGEGAMKIEESYRWPLREYLRTAHPDRWQRLSRHAHEFFKKRRGPRFAIEALYHLFAFNRIAAAGECLALSGYFRDYRLHGEQDILAEILTELTQTTWLSGPALVEAWLAKLWIQASRGRTGHLKREARKLVVLATEFAAPDRIADAWMLMGDLRMTQARPGKALLAYQHAGTILKNLNAQNPGHLPWQRELAIAYSRIGLAHQELDHFPAALGALQQSRILLESLWMQNPDHPVRTREFEKITILVNELRGLAARLEAI